MMDSVLLTSLKWKHIEGRGHRSHLFCVVPRTVTALHTQLSCWHLCVGTHMLPFVGDTLFATQQEFIFCGSSHALVSLVLSYPEPSHPEGGYLAGVASALKDCHLRHSMIGPLYLGSIYMDSNNWIENILNKTIASVLKHVYPFFLSLIFKQYSGTAIYIAFELYLVL